MNLPGRPSPFVLVASGHGTMIANVNDYRPATATEPGMYGVGSQLFLNSLFDPDEVSMTLQLLSLRRMHFGAGVVALDCGANIGVHTVEWARHMTGWGEVTAFEAQERVLLCALRQHRDQQLLQRHRRPRRDRRRGRRDRRAAAELCPAGQLRLARTAPERAERGDRPDRRLWRRSESGRAAAAHRPHAPSAARLHQDGHRGHGAGGAAGRRADPADTQADPVAGAHQGGARLVAGLPGGRWAMAASPWESHIIAVHREDPAFESLGGLTAT